MFGPDDVDHLTCLPLVRPEENGRVEGIKQELPFLDMDEKRKKSKRYKRAKQGNVTYRRLELLCLCSPKGGVVIHPNATNDVSRKNGLTLQFPRVCLTFFSRQAY